MDIKGFYTADQYKQYYEDVLDGLPTPIMIADNEMRVKFLNRAALKLLQRGGAECLGKPCAQVWQLDVCGTAQCPAHHLGEGNRQVLGRVANRDYQIDISYLENSEGERIGFVEVGTDITEVSRSNVRMSALFRNIPGGICEIELDASLYLKYASDSFYEIYGYTKEQLQDQFQNRLIGLIHPGDVQDVRNLIAEIRNSAKDELQLEHRIIRQDGTVIWIFLGGKIIRESGLINGVMIDITERKRIAEELRVREEWLHIALRKNSKYVFEYDIITKQMIQAADIAVVYGLPHIMEDVPESLLERDIISVESHEEFRKIYRDIAEGKPTASCDIKTFKEKGIIVWNRVTLTSIYDENLAPVRAIGLIEDVTKEKEFEMACFQEKQYRAAMLSDVILYIEMNITQDTFCKRKGEWNFVFEGETSYRYSNILLEAIQNAIEEEYQQLYYDTFHCENALQAFARGEFELKVEYRRKLANGRIGWMQTTMTLVRDIISSDIKGFMYVRDIDAQKRKELQLAYASQHDALTNIFNKVAMQVQIKEILETQPDKKHALFILDLDYFKLINDTYGHYVGDQVLAEAARNIKDLFRHGDIIGRIGGDEFAILVSDVLNLEDAAKMAQLLCDRFKLLLATGSHLPATSCSVGVAVSGVGGTNFKMLYQNADLALYEAKKLGRNQFIQYHAGLKKNDHVFCSGTKIESFRD